MAESAIGARPVDDHDGLPDQLRQVLAGDAGEGVGGRARPEWEDEPDGFTWIGWRDRNQRQENTEAPGSNQFLHG
jgi:hypothetical protein